MIKKILLTGIIALVIVLTSCTYEKEELLYPGGTNCQNAASKFAQVKPIFQLKCSSINSCHGAGSNNKGGEFLTHAQISAKAATIKTVILNGTMPQLGSLTAAELQSIVCWVDGGALDN